jgi:transketolase
MIARNWGESRVFFSMMKMSSLSAIRQAYGESLADLGDKYKDIVVLDADVSKSTRSAIFAEKFPDRFFNFGIAEANMVSAAAGLATMNKIPFVNTFSFLLCKRALEQIRSNIAMNKLNVKIAANYGGVSCTHEGASHHSNCDLAIMRSIPNMTLIVISDTVCMRKAIEPITVHEGPVYFRLCRAETPVIHDDTYDFKIGKGVLIRDGCDLTIIVSGILLHRVLLARNILQDQGISVRVVEMHTIKPIDKVMVIESAKKTGALLTCEEASIIGGLGSSVAEVLSLNCPTLMDMVGIPDCFTESGSYEELLDKYGMSVSEIVMKAKMLVTKKERGNS